MFSVIDVIDELNARIVACVQIRELTEEGITGIEELGEEELERMVVFYQAISFSALVAAISSGIQLDILHVHAVGTARTFDEEEL